MSVKPDGWIRRMALEHKMIEPFTDRQVREGVISYGVSSADTGAIASAAAPFDRWPYVPDTRRLRKCGYVPFSSKCGS